MVRPEILVHPVPSRDKKILVISILQCKVRDRLFFAVDYLLRIHFDPSAKSLETILNSLIASSLQVAGIVCAS
jgi:hypothetical protein